MGAPVVAVRVVGGPAQGVQRTVEGILEVGRGAHGLDLHDPYASRRHLQLHAEGGRITAADLGSSRGTTRNGQAITGTTTVEPGDRLGVGRSQLMVLAVGSLPVAVGGAPGPWHLVASDGGDVELVPGRLVTVGRDAAQVEVLVDHPTVSRVQCTFRLRGGVVEVEPRSERSATWRNGVRLTAVTDLEVGDELRFGAGELTLRLTGGSVRAIGPTTLAPAQVQVSVEGDRSTWCVEIESEPSTTIGAVLDAVAAFLGLAAAPWDGQDGAVWIAYVEDTGHLLSRAAPWWTASVRRGDRIVLGPAAGADALLGGGPGPADGAARPGRRRAVSQVPRTSHPPVPVHVTFPDVPEGTSLRGRGLTWQVGAGLLSALGGAAIGLLVGSWIIPIVFASIGVAMVASGVLGEQSRRRFRLQEFRSRVVDLDASLAALVQAQHATSWEAHPPTSVLVDWLAEPSPRLWERRPGHADLLSLRLGQASQPLLVEHDDGWRRTQSPVAAELRDVFDRHRLVTRSPLLLDAASAPVVGITGDHQVAEGLVRSVLLQVALLHSPHEVAITVLSCDGAWAWARWLPHTESAQGAEVARDEASTVALASRLLAAFGEARVHSRAAGPAPRRQVVLVIGRAIDLPVVRRVVAGARDAEALVVVLSEQRVDLPPEVVVEVTCEASGLRLRGGAELDGALAEVIDADVAMEAALGLGRLQDPRQASLVTTGARSLLELVGASSIAGLDASAWWANLPTDVLSTPVGAGDDGSPLVLDLRRSGPHALLAGTTGSGKSVFLQSLLAGLAVTHGPEVLNLFLVDYKGGSAFAHLGRLPHTVGLVTDLESDRNLTVRALTALDAELARRKELFRRAGNVEDLRQYERLPHPPEPLPSLLVVIDEYAALAQDPGNADAVERLKQVAIQGRSLGVHLLLAMQSPQGAVSDAIQKNTNVWLCLRVVQESESSLVIGRPDAARIPVDRPGRGYLRLGGGDQVAGFQTAMVVDPEQSGGSSVVVRPFVDDRPTAEVAPTSSTAARDQPLRDLCDRLVAEAERLEVPAQRRLWLAQLPTEVLPADLPDDRPARGDRLEVRIGLADLPSVPAQRTEWVDLSQVGHLLALGEFGSGKTTLLRQVVLDLAEHRSPADVHVYAIDAGGGALAALLELPHVGAVVAADDAERLVRLVQRLTDLAERRRADLAQAADGGWRRGRERGPDAAPWVVLVVDDFQVLRDSAEDVQAGRVLEQIAALLQGGPQVGIHVVMSVAQRSDLRGAVVNLFGSRVVLRQGDPVDYDLGGLRGVEARQHDPGPGRALVGGSAFAEVQVLWPAPERWVGALAAWSGRAGGPRSVERLPVEVSVEEVLGQAGPLDPGRLLLGVGGAEVEPVGFDHHRSGPHLPVYGDDLSGRSSALLAALHLSTAADPTRRAAALLCGPSPLRALADDPRVLHLADGASRAVALLDAVLEDPDVGLLLVDDVDRLPPEAAERFERLLRGARDRDLRTVVAGRASDLGRMYEGWNRYLQSLRVGLLLMPTLEAGGLVDVRLPRERPTNLAGRGYLVVRGELTPLQVARPATAS